jgi:hypothetical protein
MYTKRLAENLVQKALLLFEILSFEVYCRSDSDSPTQQYRESATLRINNMRSRRLSVSTIRESPRIVESGSRFSNTNISENSCRLLRKKNLSGVAYYAKKF